MPTDCFGAASPVQDFDEHWPAERRRRSSRGWLSDLCQMEHPEGTLLGAAGRLLRRDGHDAEGAQSLLEIALAVERWVVRGQ